MKIHYVDDTFALKDLREFSIQKILFSLIYISIV